MAYLTGMVLNGLVTDKPRSVCVSLADWSQAPCPSSRGHYQNSKKKKLGRVKITRGDRGWGRQRTMETLFQFRPQNPQPRNQDGGFSNFGDLPGRLRENQGHYKNTLETGSNFEFKMLTVIYLLSKKKTRTFPLTWEICQFFWQTKVDTDNDLVREVNTLILRNPWTSEIFLEYLFCSLCYDKSRQISGQATKTQVKRERS